ncbi:MAG: MlaD family protein [Lentisphaerales bacterium]|nr:MlaD family protein [Lentisphaerales bacterium]
MLEANKFKLGIFVSVGIVLITAAFFIHGLADKFKDRFEFYTIFDESVQGLSPGSQVKYKGVTLGNVTDIYLWEGKYVRVDMELIQGAGNKGNKSELDSIKNDQEKLEKLYDFIKEEKANGFSCQLTMSGITGLKFIEFDHVKDSKNLFQMKIDDASYIPSRKSLLAGTMLSLDEALRKIATVDFQGISNEIKSTLISFRDTYAGNNIQGAVNEVSKAAADLSSTFAFIKKKIADGEIDKTFSVLIGTLEDIKKLTNSMNEELLKMKLGKLSNTANSTLESTNDAAKQFSKSIASVETEFKITLKDIQNFSQEATKVRKDLQIISKSLGSEASDLKTDVKRSLKNLDDTLESMDALFEMLEKNPSSIFRGKQNNN